MFMIPHIANMFQGCIGSLAKTWGFACSICSINTHAGLIDAVFYVSALLKTHDSFRTTPLPPAPPHSNIR